MLVKKILQPYLSKHQFNIMGHEGDMIDKSSDFPCKLDPNKPVKLEQNPPEETSYERDPLAKIDPKRLSRKEPPKLYEGYKPFQLFVKEMKSSFVAMNEGRQGRKGHMTIINNKMRRHWKKLSEDQVWSLSRF